jgi:Fe-S-cluster-containing hydrogenase component 2
LAGADCVDIAADPAVIHAARDALQVAGDLAEVAQSRGFKIQGLPWLMVSLNDGEDPHFRKASFNPTHCPSDCPRPCEAICPAQAIVFNEFNEKNLSEESIKKNEKGLNTKGFSGVKDSHCYGCGRCLPICPLGLIETRSQIFSPAAIAPLVLEGIDAVEIHTQVGRLSEFQQLWTAILPYLPQLKLIAISCPDSTESRPEGRLEQHSENPTNQDDLIDYLWALHDLISPLPCPLIWQTDGRPMSGDIGDGATRAAVRLGQKVLNARLPGYVQLAGGTNRHTVEKLETLGLLRRCFTGEARLMHPVMNPEWVSGIAFGSYARALLSPILDELDQISLDSGEDSGKDCDASFGSGFGSGFRDEAAIAPPRLQLDSQLATFPTHLSKSPSFSVSPSSPQISSPVRLEQVPPLLWRAVALADSLLSPIKGTSSHPMPLNPMPLQPVIPKSL